MRRGAKVLVLLGLLLFLFSSTFFGLLQPAAFVGVERLQLRLDELVCHPLPLRNPVPNTAGATCLGGDQWGRDGNRCAPGVRTHPRRQAGCPLSPPGRFALAEFGQLTASLRGPRGGAPIDGGTLDLKSPPTSRRPTGSPRPSAIPGRHPERARRAPPPPLSCPRKPISQTRGGDWNPSSPRRRRRSFIDVGATGVLHTHEGPSNAF